MIVTNAIPNNPAKDATITVSILISLVALDSDWLGITNPAIPVIAIITTTTGEISFALTAASPTISPPIIDIVAPILFGNLKLASINNSKAMSNPMISNAIANGKELRGSRLRKEWK